MRPRSSFLLACVLALSFYPAQGRAQSTTGTISGRVVDAQSLPVPGATVGVASPNLLGVRTTTTSENGDYIVSLLPPGPYVVTFELSGFQPQRHAVNLSPTQTVPLSVRMELASVSVDVVVQGKTADLLTGTAQVASRFGQDMVRTLPTAGDINATLLLAPSVHSTGPGGSFSIAGSVSFENLYLLNGVTISENLRGQAYDLYVEDAIQETAIATGGVSAEFGRFSGGIVNVVTKSGGNLFSGSLRDTLNNDKWRTLSPFEDAALATGGNEPRIDKVVPTYEYTFGGPVTRDRLWFFTAGRVQEQTSGRTLIATQIPYTFIEPSKRFEFKGTYALDPNHRVQGAFTKINHEQQGYSFNQNLTMDERSLGVRQLPEDLFTLTDAGTWSPQLSIEGRYSNRHQKFIGAGAQSTDLIDGTLVLDRSRGNTRYWADTFCGICDPERRDNDDLFAKASYLLSTRRAGSHSFSAGYDGFNDKRFANNHQSGSDYRVLGTSTILTGSGSAQVIHPQFLGDGSTIIQWNPILQSSQGANFRTHSLFANDSWRVSNHLTANLGVRWDKNHGADQAGNVVARDSAISPRLGVIWDLAGDGRWTVTGSVAKYVAAISSAIADSSSAGGNAQTRQYIYRGPNINPPGTASLTPTPDALRAVFDWYFANGASNLPLNGPPTIPGVTPVIGAGLTSPHAWELSTGVARQFGSRAAVRADWTYRDYRDLYLQLGDLSTGRTTDAEGRAYDLSVIDNDRNGHLKRRYTGVSFVSNYRWGTRVDIGGNYTLSHAWGNVDGETAASGPVPFDNRYPEYKQASWNFPEGDLSVDQRHRARLWVNYSPSFASGLTLSLLEVLESGVPGFTTNARGSTPLALTAPYGTPPAGSLTTYYYGPRDEFRTAAQYRSDVAVNYAYTLPGAHRTQLFGQLQVIDVFDQFQLCACGGTVFGNGSAANAGGVNQARIDQTVQTPVTTAARFQGFDPFTATPVRGTNWDYGPNFGKALNRFAYTMPMTLRLGFGVRF